MDKNQILIEEYRALREEIDSRLKILHTLPALASILEAVFVIIGIFLVQDASPLSLTNFLLLIPLVFVGLTFNYQDNQRTLERTALYLDNDLKPKLQKIYGQEILGWEQWFSRQKSTYRFSSAHKLFALLLPLILPIIILLTQPLSTFQLVIALVDLFFLIAVILNFRYKLYRIK